MSTDKKVDNKVDEVIGKVKDRVGGATGDRDLQAEGQAQQSKS
ncbi:MAG: CsbD-like, partial [Frankiaceae bacterium]|nr:CsbD-like [Frankiaceae bacterium]